MAGRLFVAAEVGFWRNPKHVTFARAIGHPKCGASYILKLREFFLTEGTSGVLPKRFNANDVAAAVDFDGSPKKLIRALGPQCAGVLTRRRGRFVYLDWKGTSTGWWENHKEAERERIRALRARRAAEAEGGASEEGESSEPRTRTERERTRTERVTYTRHLRSNNQSASGDPPGAPPGGGSAVADARWEWFAKHHPRVRNPEVCRRYLAVLSEADWAHLQHALPLQARSSVWKNKRFVPWGDKYLREQQWLSERLPEPPRAAPADDEASRRAAEERAKRAVEERAQSAARFLLAQLEDPEIPEAQKEQLRAQWAADNPAAAPPWDARELAAAGPPS